MSGGFVCEKSTHAAKMYEPFILFIILVQSQSSTTKHISILNIFETPKKQKHIQFEAFTIIMFLKQIKSFHNFYIKKKIPKF